MRIQHLMALVVLILATVPGARAAATTTTWTGADPSGYWSAPANWSPAGVPVNGNDLVFPGGLPPGDMMSTNDLTGSFFRSITFGAASRHTIRGNPMTLTNRANVIFNSGTNVMACDLTFSGTPSTPTFGAVSIRGQLGQGSLVSELTVIGNVGGGSLYASVERLVIRGQFTGGTLRHWGGTLTLYGDDPSAGSAEIQNSVTLLVQGSRPNLNITTFWEFESAACPFLSGDGVVGDVTGCGHVILDSTLSVKSLGDRGASTYGWRVLDIHLNGTNVGEYGKLISSGDVTLTGGSLSASPGFNPQSGQVFTIVEKTSPGPITTVPGYDTNLFGPEGKIITLNGRPLRLSYVGGDGNDVTLTAMPQVNYAVSGNTAYVTSSPNASGDIVIASTYNGYPVTSIGASAFSGCTNLTSVTIPDSVTVIEFRAFTNCTSLTSVTIPNSVARIGGFAFSRCTSLTSVTIGNSVTNIEFEAFAYCTRLTNVIIGNSVTSMGRSVVYGCTSLTSVTIPASVTSLGQYAFYGCASLTNFTFLGNAPGVVPGAFFGVGAGAKAYYYCGTTGWGPTYDGLPTVMLCPPQFAPASAGVKPGGFGFTLNFLTNQTIVVEASTNLLNWQPIWTNPPPGASANFVDPEWLNHSNRFYRARSE